MRSMGFRAIYRKLRTTIPGDPAERFPCLVDLNAVRAEDQVWVTDIPYIPQQKGFPYLVAIVVLFSRNVLSWKLSISFDTEFCLNALEMALGGGRTPEIFHCDQGCQFISCDYVARLQAEEIRTSWSALAGTLRSASPASHGGTAMEGPHSLDPEERAAHFKAILETGHPKRWADLPGVRSAPVIIEDDVWISFGVTILKGVRIGKGAVIGARSIVTKDVPPYMLCYNDVKPRLTPLKPPDSNSFIEPLPPQSN
jgi:hypothetical protein